MKTLLLATLIAASSTLHAYDTEYQFGFNAPPFNSKGELTPAAVDYFLKNHAGATLWCIGKFSQASVTCYKRWYGLFANPMTAARFIVHLENDRQDQERQNVALCHTFSSTCSHDIGDAAQFTNDLQVASFPEMMLRMRPNTDFFSIYTQHPITKTWRYHTVYDVGAVGIPSEECYELAPDEQYTFDFEVPAGTGATLLFDIGTLAYTGDDVPVMHDHDLDHRFDIAHSLGVDGECYEFPDGSKACRPTFSQATIDNWKSQMINPDRMPTKFFWKARFDEMKYPHPVDEGSGQTYGCFIVPQAA